MKMLEAAHTWLKSGFATIPVRTDGTKRPVFDWSRFQSELPKPAALDLWWSENPNLGVGIVCGAVSGNLEMLEFEGRTGGLDVIPKILEAIGSESARETLTAFLDYGYVEHTPSGGLHFLYRIADHPVPGNTKIANRPSTPQELEVSPKQKIQTLAETRGEGGFVVVAPSGGNCHQSGRPWSALEGSEIGWAPTISWEDRCAIHEAIREVLDETPEQPIRVPKPATEATGDRPGDEFNAQVSWEEILEPHGWTVSHQVGIETYWVRPGKNKRAGCSATTGKEGSGAQDRLYVFSSSTEFDTEVPYTKFAAYALLEHNNDFAAASRELRKRGYGGPSRFSSSFSASAGSKPSSSPGSGPMDDEAKAEAANDLTFVVVERHLEEIGDDINARRSYCRSLIDRLVNLDGVQVGNWRDLLAGVGHLPRTEFDRLLREARIGFRNAERAKQNDRAKQSGALLPPPSEPLRVAKELLGSLATSDGVAHLTHWRGDWFKWVDTHWVQQPESVVHNWLYQRLGSAKYETPNGGVANWSPTRSKVNDVAHALGVGVLFRQHDDDPDAVVACANGVLDLKTNRLLPHSPSRFNLHSLGFNYDPEAQCPQWIKFLDESLPDSPDEQQFLQEWFGYCVSGRTDLQKIASLVGAPRSGKGTTGRVLGHLLGSATMAYPTLEHLAGQFGEQGLIGKGAAIMSDVKWNARSSTEAIPKILAISGEDNRSVSRKNQDDWVGKLGVRFTVMSNDTPKFSDASGAMVVRMIHVRFTQSFEGREDPELTEKLCAELPGILNWALEGLARLNQRGRFVVPESSRRVSSEVRDNSAPEMAFVDEYMEPGEQIDLDDAYAAFRVWCAEEGKESHHISLKSIFSRNLISAYTGSGVRIERQRIPGTDRKKRVIVGLKLQSWVPTPPKWASGTPGGRSW